MRKLMREERVVNDRYIYNWDLLCKIDPSFSVYCEQHTTTKIDRAAIIHELLTPTENGFSEEEQSIIDEVGKSALPEISINVNCKPDVITHDDLGKKLKDVVADEHSFNGVANHHAVALPPPIEILSEGSIIHRSSTSKYTVENYPKQTDKVSEVVGEHVFKDKNGNIRFCKDYYTLGKKNLFMCRNRRKSYKIIYNTKRKCLYEIILNGDTKELRCKNFSGISFTTEMSNNYKCEFVDLVIKEVMKDLPDVTVELKGSTRGNFDLTFIMLQHRYNKTIPWMTFETWRKVIDMITDKSLYSGLFSKIDVLDMRRENVDKLIHTRRNTWLKRFNRTFRKYTDLPGLVDAVYQSRKIPRTMDLFMTSDAYTCIEIHRLLAKHAYPQNLYNLLFHVVARAKKDGEQTSEIKSMVEVLRDKVNFGDNNDVLNLWVKLSTRMFEEFNEVASWSTFRDTVRLSKHYGIRIRYNKIRSHTDLNELHSTLIRYANRDHKTQRCDYTIRPFTHPETEYDGFTFEFISSTTQLTEAGTAMRNCSAGYAFACSTGTSIIFVMKKNDKIYTMIELNGQMKDVPIVQRKTVFNMALNDNTLKIIEKWHKDIVEMHKDDDGCYYNPSYNHSLEQFNNETPHQCRLA